MFSQGLSPQVYTVKLTTHTHTLAPSQYQKRQQLLTATLPLSCQQTQKRRKEISELFFASEKEKKNQSIEFGIILMNCGFAIERRRELSLAVDDVAHDNRLLLLQNISVLNL